jgi:hypothetical protein
MNTPSVAGENGNDLNGFNEDSNEMETIRLLVHEINGNNSASVDK